ncbi:MAG: pilus assembly protein PilM [Thermoleophilaceae bacterium]|nr:pilus assembly protein PilM [Thermoleophilaceae bacterium]
MSLLRNSSARRTAGLDVNGRFVAAVEIDGGRVERTVSAELPESFFRDGAVADVDGLASALEDFASSTGLPKTVRVGISNQQIAMRMIELPVIEDQKDLEVAVRFQAAEAIAMPLDEAILDYQVTETFEGVDGPRLRVVLVAARRTMVESLLAALRKAGLKVDGVDLDAFALVRMLAEDTPGSGYSKAFCHLGGVANLAVASGRLCLFTRALSTRWDIEGTASDLASEIRLSMDSYTSTPGSLPVTEVVLSGPGADDDTLVEGLESQLGLLTTVAPALGALDPAAIPAGEDASRYTVAAGLALGAAA